MIEEKMEIILITYNRSKYLDNTLNQFLNSPFKNCKFTVLDNCSPDNTPEICAKYEKLFPNMHIVRHSTNIGGNANILRAVETSESKYTWILGDDDNYDFSTVDDVIDAVVSDKYDFIYVTSCLLPTNKKNPSDKSLNDILEEENNITSTNKTSSREIHVRELIDIMKGKYFMDMAFISAYIFRTDSYDSNTLIQAYDNVPNFFPQFAFISKSVDENYFVYKSKNDIIIQGDNPDTDSEHTYTFTKFYDGWLNSALMLKDDNIRRICYQNLDNHSLTTNYYIIVVLVAIMVDKATDRPNIKNNVLSLISVLYKLTGWIKGFLISVLILLVYVVPSGIYARLYKPVYEKQQEKLGKN